MDFFLPKTFEGTPDTLEKINQIKKYKMNIVFAFVGSILIMFMFLFRYILEGNQTKTLFALPIVSVVFFLAIFISKKLENSYPITVASLLAGVFILPLRIMSTGGITSPVVVWGALVPSFFIFTASARWAYVFTSIFFVQLYLIAHYEKFGVNVLQIEPKPTTQYLVTVIGISLVMAFAIIQEITKNNYEKSIKEYDKLNLINKKMVSMGKMAGGVAHEINNPLAIISGLSSLVNKQLKDSPEYEKVSKSLQKIQSTSDRISKITGSLLQYAQQNAQQIFTPSLLNDIAKTVIETEQENLESKNIKCTFTSTDSVNLNCNSVQVDLLVTNLIKNASDAIENLDDKWINVEVRKNDNEGLLVVTDSGDGIPTDVAEKILDPFFTTKEIGKGTGLGLSLCTGIMEQHNGAFELNSESKNTQFIAKFPLA